jgi:hypothetical protein
MPYVSVARAQACSPIVARRSGSRLSWRSLPTASNKFARIPVWETQGSIKYPVSPVATASFIPPQAVAMTGSPGQAGTAVGARPPRAMKAASRRPTHAVRSKGATAQHAALRIG